MSEVVSAPAPDADMSLSDTPLVPAVEAVGKDYSDKISQINKGDSVTVVCKSLTEVVGTPMLDDCSI